MATISVSLPSDGQTIDAADYNVPINMIVTAINGNLDESNFSFSTGAINTSKITGSSEFIFDHVASGCVWSGDAYGGSLAGSMTSGVIYVNGRRTTVAAIVARTFTASKDTYVDVDSAGTITYTEATNNAASPALAAGSIRLAIIVSGATIVSVASINQGQEFKLLPIASSIPYQVTDSLGNLICPRDPNRKLLGYRQILSTVTATTQADATGLSLPVIVPSGRKIKIIFDSQQMSTNLTIGAGTYSIFIMEGGTQLATSVITSNGPGHTQPVHREVNLTTSTGLHTFKIQMASSSATVTLVASATSPSSISVELV